MSARMYAVYHVTHGDEPLGEFMAWRIESVLKYAQQEWPDLTDWTKESAGFRIKLIGHAKPRTRKRRPAMAGERRAVLSYFIKMTPQELETIGRRLTGTITWKGKLAKLIGVEPHAISRWCADGVVPFWFPDVVEGIFARRRRVDANRARLVATPADQPEQAQP